MDGLGDDNAIVTAARVSLLGETKGPESDKRLIKYLYDNEHTSPFQQVFFKFRVKVPLIIFRQWVRHRTWNYLQINEVSRRYTSEDIDFYIPEAFREQSDSNRQASTDNVMEEINGAKVKTLMETYSNMCLEFYKYLIDSGVCREQARMVIPQNMNTTFICTVDLWNLLHLLTLRKSPHAQKEFQLYAEAVEKLIEPYIPYTMEAWRESLVSK